MAFARDRHTATPGQTDFTISFPYLAQAHVKAVVNGEAQTVVDDYTFFTESIIRFNSGLTSGDDVLIYRDTSGNARLVDYSVPGTLTESDLDTDSLQAFYRSQEAIDIANESITRDASNRWDAQNTRIVNVATPVDGADATTKAYVDSALPGFLAGAEAARDAASASALAASASASVASAAEIGAVAAEGLAEQYRDEAEAFAAASDASNRVAKAGDTMTGALGIGDAPTSAKHLRVSKSQDSPVLATVENLNTGASATAIVQVESNGATIGMSAASTAGGRHGKFTFNPGSGNAGTFFLENAGTGDFIFHTGNSFTERYRFANNGALGIGGANYGTAGQVLTSGGSGAAPSWATPAKGLELLATLTASGSSSLDFTAFDSAKYAGYLFVFSKIVPASSGVQFGARYSTDGGSSWLATSGDYNYNVMGAVNATQTNLESSAATAIYMTLTTPNNGVGTSAYGLSGEARLFSPDEGYSALVSNLGYWQAAGAKVRAAGYGLYSAAATAINGIRFLMSSGNIASGKIYVYGVHK